MPKGPTHMEDDEKSYSDMILDLIEPFLPQESDKAGLEEMIELAVVGWNMQVSRANGFPNFEDMFERTMALSGMTTKQTGIVKNVIEAKEDKYPEHLNAIDHFDLQVDEDGSLNLTLAEKSYDEFMSDTAEDEGFVHREAILIKPTEAFWNWFKENDAAFEMPDLAGDYSTYLIHRKETGKETLAWIKANFDKIFIQELKEWTGDESLWPTKRTYKMFSDFFELQYSSFVMDLESEPIEKD